jgi:hypothetical protein
MSPLKKPTGVVKPKINKPSLKKPGMAAPKKVEEEKVVEVPVIVEEVQEVAPELKEALNTINECIDQIEENLAQDEKHEEQVEEEIIKEVNNEPEPEPVEEEKPKAKKTRKSTKKKEEPKEEPAPEPQQTFTYMSLEEAIDCMAINALSNESWEEAKQEVIDKLNATMIDADADPGSMRELIGEIDSLLSTLRIVRTELEKNVKADIEYIDYIKSVSSRGSNAEERKVNGYKALINHVPTGHTEAINLVQYKVFREAQLNFYNEAIEILKDRKQL